MLKNYLMAKTTSNAKCLNEINSEVSGNSNTHSEAMSSYVSMTPSS